MICGNISNFFLFCFSSISFCFVSLGFFFFFLTLKNFIFKGDRSHRTHTDTQLIYKSFSLPEDKKLTKKESQNRHCFLQLVKNAWLNTQ